MKKQALNPALYSFDMNDWCTYFNCSETNLRIAVSQVGLSISAIELYLTMNRNWMNSIAI
ncbi:MAG: hypothetical protein RIT10_1184 [Bacteroidota bacterium]|jgi:hypothetical protein